MEEKRGTVLILWPLSQTSSLPATPPSLFLVLSFFPPVLPGIKTSIHVPEETHSGGGKKGTSRGRKDEGVSRWESLRITVIRPTA